MKIQEEVFREKPVIGNFKVETINVSTGETEIYEEKNLIMTRARQTLATFISGFNGASHINRIAFGTEGHKPGDLLTPKTATEGFTAARNTLFSEVTSSYKYYIDFEPTVSGGYADVTETDVGAGSTVQVTLNGTTISYVFEMAQDAGNNGSQVPYTEAALYAGGNIFSMKCFPVRVKDNATIIRVYWSLTF